MLRGDSSGVGGEVKGFPRKALCSETPSKTGYAEDRGTLSLDDPPYPEAELGERSWPERGLPIKRLGSDGNPGCLGLSEAIPSG